MNLKHLLLALAVAAATIPVTSLGQTTAVSRSEPAAAKAEVVDGTAFVTRTDGKQSILARGAWVQRGETINTTRNSTVRLRFTDGGETVIRPETSLQVQDYNFSQNEPQKDSLVLQLLRGGLRAVSGFVGKRGNQDAYRMQTGTVTIGIRGTDYTARICNQDCQGGSQSSPVNTTAAVAARVVALSGAVTATRDNDKSSALHSASILYAGDTIETARDAHAVLVFKDNARIVVNPGTRLQLERYVFEPSAQAQASSMWVQLIRGGLRFATGLIGKSNPGSIKVRTPTATIGIRGTVFDVVCAPTASTDLGAEGSVGDMPCDQSLLVQTKSGAVELTGDKGEPLLIAAGQHGRVDGQGAQARILDAAPVYFRSLQTPEPESVPANIEQLFGVSNMPQSEGVVVTVNEGSVQLSQAQTNVVLDAGESGFAGRSLAPIKLFTTPAVIRSDPFLSKAMFNANICRR